MSFHSFLCFPYLKFDAYIIIACMLLDCHHCIPSMTHSKCSVNYANLRHIRYIDMLLQLYFTMWFHTPSLKLPYNLIGVGCPLNFLIPF